MIKKKILYKMISLYLAIVLLYTIFAGTLTLYKELEIYSLKDNHANSIYVNQLKDHADFKIDLALKFMYKSSTLPHLIDYQHINGDNYISITNVYNELLNHLSGFTQLGFSIGVINSNTDIVISPDGTFKYEKYLNSLGIFDDSLFDLDSLFSSLNGEKTFVVPQSFMKRNSNLIVMIHKINNYSTNSGLYYFTVLDTNYLLPSQSQNSDLYTFSIYKDGLIHSFVNNEDINQSFAFEYIDNNEINTNLIGLKTNSFTNYIYPSDIIPGMQYVYTIEDISPFAIFFNILKTILIPSLIIFILGLLIVYKATKTSYAPITQILNLVSDSNMEHDENIEMNELDYIKRGINKIYSDNYNLQSQLDSSLISLQEDFFRKILYAIEDDDFIEANISKLNLDSFHENLNLVLLELESLNLITKMIPINELSSVIKTAIHNFSCIDKGIDFFILPLDYKKYCIITHNLNEEEIKTLSSKIIDSISNNLGLDAVACISSSYDLINLSSAFQETLMLSKNKFSSSNSKLITDEYIKENKEITYFYPLEVETCLINYITTNEYYKSINLLKEILDKNINELQINMDTLTHLKYALLDTFKRCLNSEHNSLSNFNSEYESLMDNFIQSSTGQLEEVSIMLFEAIFECCNKDKFSLENPTASNIFMYIHENFEKDISLTDIATHFNLSTSYISKLFKNSVGINFKKYINKLKVKKAKELLATGEYKVSEVSTLVGCNSVNTFIRIFKQYESISPGEYMRNLNL